MSNNFGKCALCKKECELSFEHIPPRAAFNSTPAKPVSGMELFKNIERMPWETDGLHYSNQQQGMGVYSLCPNCNNNTGSWYGEAYTDLARKVHYLLSNDLPPEAHSLEIMNIYPLKIIKQVFSMFCSVNRNNGNSYFDYLRSFVLDKDLVGIDKSKFAVYMYFTKSLFKKYAPMSVAICGIDNKIKTLLVSEITAYPLGFVLLFDPENAINEFGVDITGFADCKFDNKAAVKMPLCIKEMNDIFPTLYRSREEIKNCVEENNRRIDEYKMNHQ